MRELYFVACGLLIGVTVRDWLEAREQRIAWKAADLAAENIEQRERWRREHPEEAATPAPSTPA